MSIEKIKRRNLLEIHLKTAIQIFRDLDQIFVISEETNQNAVTAKVLTINTFTIARNPRTSFYNFNSGKLHYRLFQDGRVQQVKDSENSSFSEGIELFICNPSAYQDVIMELEKAIAENRKEIEEQTQYTSTSIQTALN